MQQYANTVESRYTGTPRDRAQVSLYRGCYYIEVPLHWYSTVVSYKMVQTFSRVWTKTRFFIAVTSSLFIRSIERLDVTLLWRRRTRSLSRPLTIWTTFLSASILLAASIFFSATTSSAASWRCVRLASSLLVIPLASSARCHAFTIHFKQNWDESKMA